MCTQILKKYQHFLFILSTFSSSSGQSRCGFQGNTVKSVCVCVRARSFEDEMEEITTKELCFQDKLDFNTGSTCKCFSH